MGPLREVLNVMHGTDGRHIFSVYVKIYIPRNFQGGGRKCKSDPCVVEN